MKVILAELQPLIMATLKQALTGAEMASFSMTEPQAILEFVQQHPQTIMIYDGELISEEKRKFYHKVRKVQHIPMIALVPRRSDFDQENGWHLNIVKPFELSEVLTKCAQLQRQFFDQQEQRSGIRHCLKHGELHIDFDCYEVYYQQQLISLSAKEFAVLAYLAKQPNEAISRETLLTEIWGNTRMATDLRTVDHQIKGLRKKLANGKHEIEITTIYRQGYQLTLR